MPVLVTEQCMIGTGYFPAGKDQAYITQDNSVLVGTSEVPLASFHGGEILEEKDLPKRMLCRRAPASVAKPALPAKTPPGCIACISSTRSSRSSFTRPMTQSTSPCTKRSSPTASTSCKQLKLPYRVVQNCTGDMGQGKWRMYDIETWMPSRNGYGETHSGSALRDFQARRLSLRYRSERFEADDVLLHAEQHRHRLPAHSDRDHGELSECGWEHVTVPEVLRPYMNGVERIG